MSVPQCRPRGCPRQGRGETGKAKVTLQDGDRVFVGSNKGGLRRRLKLRMDDDDLVPTARPGDVHSSCFSHRDCELPRICAVARGLSFDFSTARDPDCGAQVCPRVTLTDLRRSFGSRAGLKGIDSGERVVFVGPPGLRQVHAPAPDRGAGRHHLGRARHRRAGGRRRAGRAPRTSAPPPRPRRHPYRGPARGVTPGRASVPCWDAVELPMKTTAAVIRIQGLLTLFPIVDATHGRSRIGAACPRPGRPRRQAAQAWAIKGRIRLTSS